MTNHLTYIDYLNGENDIVRDLTDQLPVGIYRTSADGKILYANPALAIMLEYKLDELYKLNVNDLFYSDEERKAEVEYFKTNDKNKNYKEIRLKTRNGKIIYVKDTVNIITDKEGKIIYFDGVLEDITEKKKAEDALKESEARYKILTDITIEGIIIHKEGFIVDINPSAQKMTGYTANAVIGKSILNFIAPENIDIAKSILNTGFTGTFEITVICANKKKLDVEVEAKNVFINGIEYKVVALRDITKRKKTESEILSLSTAVKQSPVSVVITDTKGIIEYVNPKFSEVTGYSYEEVVGKNPNILKSENTSSEDYQILWETITKGKIWTGEFLNKKKNGDLYWELASISPIIDEKENIVKYLAVKEDITERKITEDALIQSEKELSQANATKNMFFSIIAHDLKGPIGSFIQLLELLKNNFNDISNDEKIDYLNILMGLSSKTNNLLEDLLVWARIQMNTLEFSINMVTLKDIVNNAIHIIEEKAHEKNIKITAQIDDIEVNVNENSVKTILRNLLSNAIKFSYNNSYLEVKSKILCDQNLVEISVKDNGVGIAKGNINKLFKIETSFSTYGTEKEKGTGLGLILCKELVEKNGGSIRAESKEDSGSTFYFTLPIK